MPDEDEKYRRSLSQVLREEFEALRPECCADSWGAGDEEQKRQEAYKIAHDLQLSALTLSVGGILRATSDTKASDVPYCALGTIEYLNDGDGCTTGKILYIEPIVRGDEPAVESSPIFAPTRIFLISRLPNNDSTSPSSNPTRVLGYWMTKRIVAAAESSGSIDALKEFFESLLHLDLATLRPRATSN